MEDKNTQYFNLFYSRIYIYPKVQSLKSIFLTDSTHIHANFLQKFSFSNELPQFVQNEFWGIISFGITVYETAICQLPSFVISHSDENDLAAKFVENFGWISYIGKYNEIKYDEIPKMTFNLINDQSKLQKMIQSCKQIDGLGPSNVANSIINL